MSWKSAASYAKNIAQNKGWYGDSNTAAILPLGARIGGLIQWQPMPFIRAVTQGSLIVAPVESHAIIKAISRVKLSMSGSVYRYYLETGDEQEKEAFLQLYLNDKKELTELIYCTQLARIIPETEEDQQIFMGLSGYGLGDKNYCLWRSQLEGLGYSSLVLQAAFGVDDAIQYERDLGDPLDDFIAPLRGTETRLDDELGERGLQQDIYFMPYRREGVNGFTEYLLITTELVNSRNGNATQRDIHVDIMVGIPLDVERVQIR